MDPATGASTWAFGSQRCVRYRGILTIKAAIVISHHKGYNGEGSCGDIICRLIDKWLLVDIRNINLIRRGKEAVIVYSIKYIPA